MQDWGRPGDLWNLDIRWHVPSVEENSFVFYILDLILQPELQRLQRFAQGEQDMGRYGVFTCAPCRNDIDISTEVTKCLLMLFFSRDDVLQSLTIIQHCLLGAGSLMPPLKGEPIPEL